MKKLCEKNEIRHDWTVEEMRDFFEMPLLDLISKAHHIHNRFHKISEVQVCKLISVKTGGCSEDCSYCAQSSRYQTSVTAQSMMSYDEVMRIARDAASRGVTRICLGAAWREVRDNKQFEDILSMVKGIADLGLEVCCTLGLLKEHQAQRLKEAGLYAYNHNLDSSERFYKTIITTRTYQDRLNTLEVVQKSGLTVCCGGIFGMGESLQDRLELLHTLCTRDPHPESVPINALKAISGTPLQDQPKISIWEMVRVVAIARIVMPKAMVRLSAGRVEMNFVEQVLCFLAGANSIFDGSKLLTIPNTASDSDDEMFRVLGLTKRSSYSSNCGS